MDPIKEAFAKIKRDIETLRNEILSIRKEIESLKLLNLNYNLNPTNPTHNPTNTFIPTDKPTNPTHNPTDNLALKSLRTQNFNFSTRNEGVPTDKPTNQQTNQQTDFYKESSHNIENFTKNYYNYDMNSPQTKESFTFNNGSGSSGDLQNLIKNPSFFKTKDTLSDFEKAREILESLDTIKKSIRLKFKKLTNQEMLVFSTLYALEEQKIEEITYKILANNLNLSESSIRDYINKLIQKGIPIEKKRQNNKTITLSISQELKNIATLATIIQLREL